jgi:hypothetical protein
MRTIPPFSKKSSTGPTVGGGGHRSGFLQNVTSTNAGKGKAVPHMAAMYPTKSTSGQTSGGKSGRHPSFKSRSGSGLKSPAAFSKKKV